MSNGHRKDWNIEVGVQTCQFLRCLLIFRALRGQIEILFGQRRDSNHCPSATNFYSWQRPSWRKDGSSSSQCHTIVTNSKEEQYRTKVQGVGDITALTLRPYLGQQGTIRTKSRCRLLSRLTTTTQSVRRARPTTQHHQGWQRLSPKSADRMREHILRPHGRDSALRQWGLRLAARGGKQAKNKAVVAVARKLAVLLHRIWVTQEPYVPFYAEAA